MKIHFLHLQRITLTILSTIASILRLFNSPRQHSSDRTSGVAGNHVVILDTSSTSLRRVPVNVVTDFIKKKVEIIRYSDSGCRYRGGRTAVCMVCLDGIDGCDPIRELVNCEHVFHRECLDTWIDVGRVTCPVCRSMLLSPKKLLSSIIATAANDHTDLVM